MQTKLKSVSNFKSKSTIIVLVFLSNLVFSQEISFDLKNKTFQIIENNSILYNDDENFLNGSCNLFEILKSPFVNQFYFYVENTCTTKTIKQLYKIMWQNKKFRILNKEYYEIKGNTINSKIILYKNYIIDSLKIDLLEIEENLTNDKIGKTPIFIGNKIIGYKKSLKKDSIFNNPTIDYYQNIKDVNLYNNIAYNLFENKAYEESLYILNKIIKKFPTRAVAYLNIADCYWELNNNQKAIDNYKKYIQQMKIQKKNLNKIPKYVFKRIK